MSAEQRHEFHLTPIAERTSGVTALHGTVTLLSYLYFIIHHHNCVVFLSSFVESRPIGTYLSNSKLISLYRIIIKSCLFSHTYMYINFSLQVM